MSEHDENEPGGLVGDIPDVGDMSVAEVRAIGDRPFVLSYATSQDKPQTNSSTSCSSLDTGF